MVIVFLLFLYIHVGNCQITTAKTPNWLHNCSFLNDIYLSNAAVSDQFQFNNYTSISLTANFAFTPSSFSLSSFEFGLIYRFPTSNYLVPFPVIFDCASIVHSCQLKTITGTTTALRDSEPIRVQLTPFNYMSTITRTPFNQMGLYLKQGRYEISNCSLNNGQQTTDPKTIFNIQIQYEKPVGSSCNPTNDICGSPSLTNCSSSTCTCHSLSSALVSYSDSLYCADMLSISNCKTFPSRCVTWCNGTSNYLCICPSGSFKFQRNNVFICQLPINSNNCSISDNDVQRCPSEQCCINGQCIDCSMTSTTSKTLNMNDSSVDDRTRIIFGIVVGLLGTSVVVLLGAFLWLNNKQKRRQQRAEKSHSPSYASSTSSLYISPNQRHDTFPSSMSMLYQLPLNEENKNKTIHRTDSFRQAVLSGNRQKQITERVSTKRDSFTHQKGGWSSPTFSALEFMTPSMNNQNQSFDLDKENNNIYHIIVPPTSMHTHAV
ncbi:unnamed protein product [Rotaria socialis]|uniref:EGF-like domain-containing protein n=1 Tax=Rotaria socialis TaxID=392032 RepID=A0A818YFJ0_9BILA|nr:unnamed protein product [Rotaria socialis]CAF4582488.1 unnamed protein product [Rotaria socialis]